MPKIGICSIFRNNESSGSFPRYFEQLAALTLPEIDLVYSWREGDSTDDTWEVLCDQAKELPNVVLCKHDLHLPFYGSIITKSRLSAVAGLCNATIEAIVNRVEYIIWIESDLIYEPDMISRLLEKLQYPGVDIIAPLTQIDDRGQKLNYDVWAYRHTTGEHWTHGEGFSTPLVEVSSVGSVWMYRSDIFKAGIKHTPEETVVGFCRNARRCRYKIFVDTTTAVQHPNRGYIDGRWIG